jgi:ATP-dependent Clp protease adapter protein ClpS
MSTAPGVLDRPDVGDTQGGSGWVVTVYDNDFNTEAQVIGILLEATGCPLDEAEMETWEVHNLGRSTVHHGGQEECERVAAVIRRIGIRVEVTEE